LLLDLCNELNINTLFVGTEFASCHPNHPFENIAALNDYLATHHPEDTLILLKGSRGMKMEDVKI
jgi:UDP-N-acetylmuramyl pentapeptide synthase